MGLSIQHLASLGILFVVAIIAISIGAQITENVAEEVCPSNSTWGHYTNSSVYGANVETGNEWGCCWNINASDSMECINWSYGAASNTTIQGMEGLLTFAEWFGILALVLMAAIIIGVLVTYLGRSM